MLHSIRNDKTPCYCPLSYNPTYQDFPRMRGSSTSRMASPTRFQPITKSTSVNPGHTTMYQYFSRLVIQLRAKLNTWPQSA